MLSLECLLQQKGPSESAKLVGECMSRADRASGQTISPRNDIYWYTREEGYSLLRRTFPNHKMTVMWPEALGNSHRDILTGMVPNRRSRAGDELLEALWSHLAHPMILIREVHQA